MRPLPPAHTALAATLRQAVRAQLARAATPHSLANHHRQAPHAPHLLVHLPPLLLAGEGGEHALAGKPLHRLGLLLLLLLSQEDLCADAQVRGRGQVRRAGSVQAPGWGQRRAGGGAVQQLCTAAGALSLRAGPQPGCLTRELGGLHRRRLLLRLFCRAHDQAVEPLVPARASGAAALEWPHLHHHGSREWTNCRYNCASSLRTSDAA